MKSKSKTRKPANRSRSSLPAKAKQSSRSKVSRRGSRLASVPTGTNLYYVVFSGQGSELTFHLMMRRKGQMVSACGIILLDSLQSAESLRNMAFHESIPKGTECCRMCHGRQKQFLGLTVIKGSARKSSRRSISDAGGQLHFFEGESYITSGL